MIEPKKIKGLFKSPYVWAFTTYFAEGFPYSIIRSISSVFFRDMGVSLEAIGFTSLFGVPWTLKFLWGPLVDQYATKRSWMLCMQFLLVLLVTAAAFMVPLSNGVRIIAVLLFIGAFIAATHDIAIDGYYMEALDKEGQAKFVGYRVMAYRIALMTGSGVIVTIAARAEWLIRFLGTWITGREVVITIGVKASWLIGFLTAAVLLGVLFLYHFFLLPKAEQDKLLIREMIKKALHIKIILLLAFLVFDFIFLRWFFSQTWFETWYGTIPVLSKMKLPGWIAIGLFLSLISLAVNKARIFRWVKTRDSFYGKAIMSYIDRPGIWIALAFIILMRAGEFMLSSMMSPFMVDLGIKVHYGWIAGGVGLPCSIIGAMLGGWMIARFSLKKMIWPFLLAQNLTNVFYMLVALYLQTLILINTGASSPTPIGLENLLWVAGMHGFDQFSGGLGTAVLTTFLLRTCLPEYKAAHFAIGTGLMSLIGVFAGIAGGFLAQRYGYGYFFGISFLASLPGMALIFFIPFLGEDKKAVVTERG